MSAVHKFSHQGRRGRMPKYRVSKLLRVALLILMSSDEGCITLSSLPLFLHGLPFYGHVSSWLHLISIQAIMTGFLDLPVELLPLILQHIVRPAHIASLCLVNKQFQTFATSQLYERVFIFAWHTDSKTRVSFNSWWFARKLCSSRSRGYSCSTHLISMSHLQNMYDNLVSHSFNMHCVYQRRWYFCWHGNYDWLSLCRTTAIRDFPKPFSFAERKSLLELCSRGVRNCVNLRSCTWTRDGSLTTDILDSLKACPDLQELEINGHHDGHYDPSVLADFKRLRRISLIMPSSPVIDILPYWTSNCTNSLRHLSLICKVTIYIWRFSPRALKSRETELVPCDRHSPRANRSFDDAFGALIYCWLSKGYSSRYPGLDERKSVGFSRPWNWSGIAYICEWFDWSNRSWQKLLKHTWALRIWLSSTELPSGAVGFYGCDL